MEKLIGFDESWRKDNLKVSIKKNEELLDGF